MNIAFHSNQLGIRGTEVALYDYALYNELILGNKSYIISDANSNLDTLKKFESKFEVFLYQTFNEINSFVDKLKIDSVYFIKAGDNDGKVAVNAKNLIHAVFQHKDPHGDKYAYVSKWLAEKMNMPNQYVPHIVWLPETTDNLRLKLSIPKHNIVIGRHGGFNDFDLPFVHKSVYEVAKERKDITFVFMNTRPFCPCLENIIHVNGTYNLQNKANYISMCDYMLHARQHGESFGLAISEFLFHDKPVISWKGGLDSNHLNLLNSNGLWYEDYNSIKTILQNIQISQHTAGQYKDLVTEFLPANVMNQFNKIFLT